MSYVPAPEIKTSSRDKTPWYKQWWVIVLGAVVLVAIIVNGVISENVKIEIIDVVGKTGDVAKSELEAIGFKVEFKNDDSMVLSPKNWVVISQIPEAGTLEPRKTKIQLFVDRPEPDALVSSDQENKPGQTTTAEAYDGTAYAARITKAWQAGYGVKDWSEIDDPTIFVSTITEIASPQEGVIEVKSNGNFTLRELHQSAVGQQNIIADNSLHEIIIITELHRVSSNDPAPNTTDAGLTKETARDMCEYAGKYEFPYGFQPRWIVGVYGETVSANDWFIKTDVRIENEFGNKLDAIMECRVGGTDSNPELLGFNVYR